MASSTLITPELLMLKGQVPDTLQARLSFSRFFTGMGSPTMVPISEFSSTSQVVSSTMNSGSVSTMTTVTVMVASGGSGARRCPS